MDPWIPSLCTSDIPNSERQVLVLDRLDVKANGRDRGHDLTCHNVSKCSVMNSPKKYHSLYKSVFCKMLMHLVSLNLILVNSALTKI